MYIHNVLSCIYTLTKTLTGCVDRAGSCVQSTDQTAEKSEDMSVEAQWCNSLLELPAESDFYQLHGKGKNTVPKHRHMGCNIWWQKTGHIPSLDSSTALQGEIRQVIKCARVALWRHVHVACRPPITSWGSSLTRKLNLTLFYWFNWKQRDTVKMLAASD